MIPLVMADRLADYIIGTVVETIETEKLMGGVRADYPERRVHQCHAHGGCGTKTASVYEGKGRED